MSKTLLDLHGKRAEEVEALIDRFLMNLTKTELKSARIMTGKGTGVVKSVVIKYLKMAGYHWTFEKLSNGKPNEGCLIVFLE